MNYKIVFRVIGNILRVEAGLLLIPFLVSLIYQEDLYLAYILPIVLLIILSFLFKMKKTESTKIYAKEGFVIVGLSWILISLFGSLPFIISGEIPGFFDAFFETVSGLQLLEHQS